MNEVPNRANHPNRQVPYSPIANIEDRYHYASQVANIKQAGYDADNYEEITGGTREDSNSYDKVQGAIRDAIAVRKERDRVRRSK